MLNGGWQRTIVNQRQFIERCLAFPLDVVLLLYFDNELFDLQVDPPKRNRKAKERRAQPAPWLIRTPRRATVC